MIREVPPPSSGSDEAGGRTPIVTSIALASALLKLLWGGSSDAHSPGGGVTTKPGSRPRKRTSTDPGARSG